ncbi:MAG: short-chain fatty acid transporter [Desulfosalsimonas sp.]
MQQETGAKGSFLERMGFGISANVEKWMPNPYLFAIILTFITFVLGIVFAEQGPIEMVDHWGNGFWDLHTFAMQMVLVLVTGYVLAYHRLTRKLILGLARLPKNGGQAVVMVALVAMILSWINWGLGLIVGAIIARETGRQAYFSNIKVHYPLLCTAGYMGLGLTWHWGLAGSAPLLSATEGHVFEDLIGVIPAGQTIFSGYGLALSLLSIIYASIIIYLLSPKSEERIRGIDYYVPEAVERQEEEGEKQGREQYATVAEKIDNSKILGGLLAFMGIIYIIRYFFVKGESLNIDIVNFCFLFIGLALYTSPRTYLENFYTAVKSAAGIILQFPFYAGIMGMISLSGLGVIMAGWLVDISTPATFPVISWLTAGLANLFVPSGGGEWSVVGETVLRAAQDLDVPIGKTIMAYSVGDAWTNLFQPFWAIPLLGITGIKARHMFGYCITMLILLIPFLAVALSVIPY